MSDSGYNNSVINDLQERLKREEEQSQSLRLILAYTIYQLGGTVKIPYSFLIEADYGTIVTTLDINRAVTIRWLSDKLSGKKD